MPYTIKHSFVHTMYIDELHPDFREEFSRHFHANLEELWLFSLHHPKDASAKYKWLTLDPDPLEEVEYSF
jgi:hypothetical protein